MVHGFVDFNLQIPANAAFFYSLSALATVRLSKPDLNYEFSRERGLQG
jgi:hypothetical protein